MLDNNPPKYSKLYDNDFQVTLKQIKLSEAQLTFFLIMKSRPESVDGFPDKTQLSKSMKSDNVITLICTCIQATEMVTVKVLRCSPDSMLQSLQSHWINVAHYKPITPCFHAFSITLDQQSKLLIG